MLHVKKFQFCEHGNLKQSVEIKKLTLFIVVYEGCGSLQKWECQVSAFTYEFTVRDHSWKRFECAELFAEKTPDIQIVAIVSDRLKRQDLQY